MSSDSEDDLRKRTSNAALTLTGELITAAKESEHGKEAANNIGKTAVTLTKAVNNCLLPLAAVNFAFDQAKKYFEEKFSEDIAEKTKDIPKEDLIEPRPSVAGPVLQGLAFSHDEEELKNLYLNLLSTAMDRDQETNAHPAFVEIIRQLTSEEARLIQSILKMDSLFPVVRIKVQTKGKEGYKTEQLHVMRYQHQDGSPDENPRIPAMVENWKRLGLVSVSYDVFLIKEDAYSWVEDRPEYLRVVERSDNENEIVSFDRGVIERTELGKLFANAVGISD